MNADFSKPQVLECPSCGATLALPDADTFVCDYCGKTILVPENLRPRRTALEKSSSSGAGDSTNIDWYEALPPEDEGQPLLRKRINAFIALSIGITVLVAGLVTFFLFYNPTDRSTTIIQSTESALRTTPLSTLVQFARLGMVFGSEGDQPGQFDDARSIAIDPQGNIFVADYTSGHINKFDSQGNFLQMIQVPSSNENPDIFIFSIVTDEFNNLYVTADGNILKYDTLTGKLIQTIPDQWPEIYFESVIVSPDGNLYATNGMAGADDVVILSPKGEVLAHWINVIESVNHDDPRISLAMAVSHSGIVYILSPFGNQVYVYNPDGSFNFRFGEEGDRAGQFSLSTGMLAITDQDYLVISDVYRVDLFDPKGAYLGKTFTIDYRLAEGSMYGMTIDSKGDLYYISSGGKVLKFDMNYP